MPLVSEVVHPRGLSFHQQRRVVKLRDGEGFSWVAIAERVWNLKGERPTWKTCSRVYKRFAAPTGRAKYKYFRCGRKKKLTEADKTWLVGRLLQLRKKGPCTSAMLQRLLASKRRVTVESSLVRRALQERGYKWLRRSQKPKYDSRVRALRKAFAQEVLDLSDAALREKLSMCLDGVVLSVPPQGLVARENYLRAEEKFCWRKPDEADSPDLEGGDRYKKQVPLARAVPLWGGCSAGGFSVVLWHENKKVTSEEWSGAVRCGKLKEAILRMKPVRRRGPWFILTDNESFLRAPASVEAHRMAKIQLWGIPPRSPDLNPVEKFWSWLRRAVAAKDLVDLRCGRAPVDKAAFKLRVQRLLRTRKAQGVASNCTLNLKKVCAEVVRKDGAASRT
jgi:transposase